MTTSTPSYTTSWDTITARSLKPAMAPLIYIETTDNLTAFKDGRVVAEGQMSGIDRMSVTWLGPAAD
ncbi:hypothetical protein [Novosphingobium sp.]|uniref:hypothetical protein n=1 Tax=Novosphingobium sp. TaxID=1874826 RepID=UPI0038B96DB5